MAKLSLDELALLELAVLDLAVLLNPLPISMKLVVVESAFLGGAVGQDDFFDAKACGGQNLFLDAADPHHPAAQADLAKVVQDAGIQPE